MATQFVRHSRNIQKTEWIIRMDEFVSFCGILVIQFTLGFRGRYIEFCDEAIKEGGRRDLVVWKYGSRGQTQGQTSMPVKWYFTNINPKITLSPRLRNLGQK